MQLKRNIMTCRFITAGEILHIQKHIPDFIVFRRELIGHFTADHQADNLCLSQLFGFFGCYPLTVTHDGDFVGYSEDFIHFMADVDDADALSRQALHNTEQMFHFILCQGTGRFIQNQDFGIVGNRLADFHHLPFGNGETADDLLRININLQLFKDCFRFLIHLFAVHYPQLIGREAAQPHVFHYIPAQHLIQLLMHHGNAVVQRITRTGEGYRMPVHRDRATVTGINAKEALHQRGFSRAVFPHEGMHRTGSQLQFCMIQCLNTGELFIYIQHL